MNNVVGKVERKKGLMYKVDKDGNIVESKYNFLKDPYTLVMLTVVILGGLYYMEMSKSATNAAHFGEYCLKYSEMVSFWERTMNQTWNNSLGINELIQFYNFNYKKVNSIPIFSNNG